jgi:hypothetical protein
MDPFFKYVAIGALVILILVLIFIGVSMSKVQSNDVFPPTQNACPDYWDVSSNPQYCGIPLNDTMRNRGYIKLDNSTPKKVETSSKQNVGMCTGSGFGCKTSATYLGLQPAPVGDFQYVQLNNNPSWTKMYPAMSEICAKKRWASSMNINWDGVSNYNAC